MVAVTMWSCTAALPQRSAVQVELLEDEVAKVVDLDSGRESEIPRKLLPRGVNEGDVVVDGRIDRALTAELRRQVEEIHARLAVPVPRGLDLSADDSTRGDEPVRGVSDPLTADPE
ncbi:MAG: DUF3006 domain-containing protein [Myxococcaceae bacterium]